MNLAEALLQALPELPTQVVANKNFKFNPDLVVRHEIDENGQPVNVVFVPDKSAMYYIEDPQWMLFQLFDGERNFAEVAQAYEEQTGTPIPETDVRDFAVASADTGLWYESAQERNITLSQKLKEERQKRIKRKGKFADLSHVIFQGWDPDRFLTWAHKRFYFIYTPWFTVLTLGLFAFMTYIWVDRWTEIGRDTILYYTFTQKTAGDLLEFWLLFLFMAFFHESAHGLTSKHYGASIHNMGFQLIYLAPAFAVEITELWARVGRRERLIAIIAGVWIEMVFCGIATVVWWGTLPGTGVHEWAYKLMMITGIIVLIVNLNPLMKLDGYYALAEIVGVSELKERSTAFLSGWVKRYVWGLPVVYDYVPPRRRWLFVPYALLSGAYGYLLLFAVSRFTFNVFHRFTPEWAFLPAGLVAWKIFKSRILRLLSFMKTVYQHHVEKLKLVTSPTVRLAAAAVVVVFLCLPIFRKTADAPFVLEPVQRATLRATAPGFVQRVFVDENSPVAAGTPLVVLKNSELESDAALADADLKLAQSRRTRAQVQFTALGASQTELRRASEIDSTAQRQLSQMRISSPIAGIVATPRVRDLEGTYIAAGTLIADIDDLNTLRARLYLPESDVREMRPGAVVSLLVHSGWTVTRGRVGSISIASSELPSGLVEQNKYKGLNPPAYYVVDVVVPNPGSLRPGMSGDAKVFLRRQSLAGRAWETLRDAVARRMW
jgi:putative peptide zinc metalloprotease protein